MFKRPPPGFEPGSRPSLVRLYPIELWRFVILVNFTLVKNGIVAN